MVRELPLFWSFLALEMELFGISSVLWRFGVEDDNVLNFCSAAMKERFLGPRVFNFGFSVSLPLGKDWKLEYFLSVISFSSTTPWLSSEEDCLEDDDDTGDEVLEELGKGEDCLESDRLSSNPESLERIESWGFLELVLQQIQKPI